MKSPDLAFRWNTNLHSLGHDDLILRFFLPCCYGISTVITEINLLAISQFFRFSQQQNELNLNLGVLHAEETSYSVQQL